MIKEFINDFKNIDSKVMNVMNNGFKISLIISLFSGYILTLYSTYPISHIAYLCGLSLFKLSLTCIATFITCGMSTNKIIKEI